MYMLLQYAIKTKSIRKTIIIFSFAQDECLNVLKCHFDMKNVYVCFFLISRLSYIYFRLKMFTDCKFNCYFNLDLLCIVFHCGM